MKKRTQSGFTLYELLITMLIVGVVLTLGIPNMSAFTANSRMTSTANDLHASFQMARSEAARAKTNITICASANALAAGANCGGTCTMTIDNTELQNITAANLFITNLLNGIFVDNVTAANSANIGNLDLARDLSGLDR